MTTKICWIALLGQHSLSFHPHFYPRSLTAANLFFISVMYHFKNIQVELYSVQPLRWAFFFFSLTKYNSLETSSSSSFITELYSMDYHCLFNDSPVEKKKNLSCFLSFFLIPEQKTQEQRYSLLYFPLFLLSCFRVLYCFIFRTFLLAILLAYIFWQ